MKVPVLTGDKKWIDVMGRDQGFFLRFRKAEWNSELAKEEPGMG